jgi:hypothetical protein
MLIQEPVQVSSVKKDNKLMDEVRKLIKFYFPRLLFGQI